MILPEITAAKRAAVRARARFFSTLVATQSRLHPNNLAEEAWDGVKTKSADMADNALEAVKDRPVAVTATLGAIALYLARAPLKRVVTRLISRDRQDGIESADAELSERDGAPAPTS